MVIDEWGDIQCIFCLLTRRLKVTNKLNISRYVNIDKVVHIQYIFLLARLAYSWLFQLAQMWKLLAPGVRLVDFVTPAVLLKYFVVPQGMVSQLFESWAVKKLLCNFDICVLYMYACKNVCLRINWQVLKIHCKAFFFREFFFYKNYSRLMDL